MFLTHHALSLALAVAVTTAPAAAQCTTPERELQTTGAIWFGNATALWGDTAVVGASYSEFNGLESGAAYVFVGRAGWTEAQKLLPSNGEERARFGNGVAVCGDVAVVGAPGAGTAGHAYVFERDAGGVDAWGETALLSPFPVAEPLRQFGSAVSLDGETLVVGHPRSQDDGAVLVFERGFPGVPNQFGWGEVGRLTASDGTQFADLGFAVSISGDVIVGGAKGAFNGSGVRSGAAYVFERNAGGADAWGQVAKLEATGGADDDRFGAAVSVSGNTIFVGSYQDDQKATNAGAAHVFERDPLGNWVEVVKLFAFNGGSNKNYGLSASVSGDSAIVGSASLRQAYVYERDLGGPDQWGLSHTYYHPPQNSIGSFFGRSVASSGRNYLCGAPDQPSVVDEGRAFVFEQTGPPPAPYCTAGTTSTGCRALMSTLGNASATSPEGFELVATGVEAQKVGLVFYSVNGPSATAWGGTSTMCVQAPFQRSPLQYSGGTAGECDGTLLLDWCAFVTGRPNAQGTPFLGGETVCAQAVFRTPNATPPATLSDAIAFTVCP
jgi:hypothetical protein